MPRSSRRAAPPARARRSFGGRRWRSAKGARPGLPPTSTPASTRSSRPRSRPSSTPRGRAGAPPEPEQGAALQWIDGERWLCTGDVGRIDDDGYLWITDRKNDVFDLSTGKSVAPAPLETLVKRSEWISQGVGYGESRPHVTALCTLNPAALGTLAAAVPEQHPEVRAHVERAIAAANRELAPFEQIRRFAIVHPDFSLESGELTATLETRRRAIISRHAGLLASLYDDACHERRTERATLERILRSALLVDATVRRAARQLVVH